MIISRNDKNTLNYLIDIIEKNKMFYSLGRDFLDYIFRGEIDDLTPQNFSVILKPDDYFKLKLLYPSNFIDNSDLLKGELCPLFINGEYGINIYFFVPTNKQKYQCFLKKIAQNNYSFVLENKLKFKKNTIFKSMLIKTFRFIKKETNFKLLLSKLLEHEYSYFAYIHSYIQSNKNNLYTNISFKTDLIDFEDTKYKYFIEYKNETH
ncbi:hypothetical protein [Mycoplasma elephantis]|uniref:hypothetical protein n=1 Tax=Mycoplasma elephantis TaxID=114882 RepID=UPI0004875500|nr:hypothetical protein [Mycoplasma elephantis]